QFENHLLYHHKTLCINYTTYDMQHDQDCINPWNHVNIMVLTHKDDDKLDAHSYWYAQALGVFHANVQYLGEGSTLHDFERIEFV
ncbi:hypothetical protein BDY19DRAFT_883253, partial [Irpex rosettiformis]